MEAKKAPDCYKCIHRRKLAGSVHSECHHPATEGIHSNPMAQLAGILGGVVIDMDNTLGIVGNPHGIKNGWFAWPINFDPTWLLNCNGFEEKGNEDGSQHNS